MRVRADIAELPRPCRIDECSNPAAQHKTLCHKHRKRVRMGGDPHVTQWGTADPTDVELIVRDPRPVEGLTRLERRLVARGMTARGETAAEIARIVGVDWRTVMRWRALDRTDGHGHCATHLPALDTESEAA